MVRINGADMARAHIPQKIQNSVLTACRRRCSICYGLNRDTAIKAGQIAHLDQDNANASLENLVFLCFEHHDAFDSKPSQRKGFTVGEVAEYRAELRNAVRRQIDEEVKIGAVTLRERDPYAGHYVGEHRSLAWAAELDLTPVPDMATGSIRYFVSGFAILGGHRPTGPNMGTLDFVAELKEGRLHHVFYNGDERDAQPHEIWIDLQEDGLTLNEINEMGSYGFCVSFKGAYKRAEKLNFSEWEWENDEARGHFRQTTRDT
jgi:hypothetical protein